MENAEYYLLHYKDYSNIRINQQNNKENSKLITGVAYYNNSKGNDEPICCICGG